MSNKFKHTRCCLCHVPIGITFNKDDIQEDIYCLICGESIMSLVNVFKENYYNFDAFFDMGDQQSKYNFGKRFDYRKAALSYFMEHVETKEMKDLKYKSIIRANKLQKTLDKPE